MSKFHAYRVTADYALLSTVSGKLFAGVDYEGVGRYETTIYIARTTNRRYIPGIVRRFLDERDARIREGLQNALIDAEADGTFTLGDRVRFGFARSADQDRDINQYAITDETYILALDTQSVRNAGSDGAYGFNRRGARRYR